MKLTAKSALLWSLVIVACLLVGPRHAAIVLSVAAVAMVAVRFKCLSRLERWLSDAFFPPRKQPRRGHFRYSRDARSATIHGSHKRRPRLSIREYAQDSRRDQVISAETRITENGHRQQETQQPSLVVVTIDSSAEPRPTLIDLDKKAA